MAKRTRIGLTFSYNEQWIAGSYYILNIIHALNLLDDSIKPVVVIISEDIKNYVLVEQETKYPFLEFFEFPVKKPTYTVVERSVNYIGRIFGKRKWISKRPARLETEMVYPFEVEKLSENHLKKVNWVPDFQEMHLPQLFPKEVLEQRKKHHRDIICKGDWVVFSSRDSQKDFNTLYPETDVRQFVLPFAVSHPEFEHENLSILLKKYGLPDSYYFAPNQFWAHKNHMVILRALRELKDTDVSVHVAFSGKEDDHRNADYVEQLKQYIDENDLTNYVSFLGFIPRSEQLKLMKESVAVIQPSKFEGWSTVVEDAKALSQYLLVSDLNVHKEQIQENVSFFAPNDFSALSELLKRFWSNAPDVKQMNYHLNKLKFGENFLELVKEVTTHD